MEETRFSFIIHPLNRTHLLRVKRRALSGGKFFTLPFKKRLRSFPESPTCMATIPFFSNQGKRVVCDVILCPLLPGQMVMDESSAVSEIIKSVEIAKARGSRIVGLGGFTSIVGNGGLDIANQVSLPVTSGNTYTTASVVRSVVTLGEVLSVNFFDSCIAIIGATGDIGSACAKSFSGLFGKIILVARDDTRLEELAQSLKSSGAAISIEKKASKAAARADVVITVTSSLTTLLEAKDLKKNSLVCDVSYPANVAREIQKERPDIIVFEGGIVSSNYYISQLESNSLFWEFNPNGGMHACFVETLLLALEGKFCNYSIGRGSISPEKIQEISLVADRYNFHPVLSWGGITYDARGIKKRMIEGKFETVHA